MSHYDVDSGYYADGIEQLLDRDHEAGVRKNEQSMRTRKAPAMMFDNLDSPPPPRRASARQVARFREAFKAELRADPNRPPGPARLARRLDLTNTRSLNGRLTALRTEMLLEAGFKKDPFRNRWYRP